MQTSYIPSTICSKIHYLQKHKENAHMSFSQSSEFCTCHDKIIIHKNNTAKMIDHAKEAFQHEQILLCVNQAKVSIETPLYSWLLT